MSNRQNVYSFLKNDIGLDEQQQQALEQNLKNFNFNIYDQPVEGALAIKKAIFDRYGATKKAFTCYSRILTIPLGTLYARMQFFEEVGAKITSENLMKTLGMSNNQFVEGYKEYFIMKELLPMDRAECVKRVKQAMSERYPLPGNKKEIIKKIKEREGEGK